MRMRALISTDVPLLYLGIESCIKRHFPESEVEHIAKNEANKELLEWLAVGEKRIFTIHFDDYRDIFFVRQVQQQVDLTGTLIIYSSILPPSLDRFHLRGNRAVVEFGCSEEDFVAALKSLLEGKDYVSPSTEASMMMGDVQSLRNPYGLTLRECEVLRLIAAGMPTTTISYALQISVHTVRNHLSHIYEKMKVSDRVTAVIKGIEAGIIPLYQPRRNELLG